MLQELKAFITRGNVIDLAVGVAIGAAFTAIVNSVVNDLINPLIGLLLGGLDFAGLSFSVGDATFTYGNLIMSIINFLLVATVLFFVIKAINMFNKKQAASPAPPAAPTTDQKLLMEIRDLLAANNAGPVVAPQVVATTPIAEIK
ncbi:MAG: large conductance mechanosensitive channel protein MscL [Caldilineaceae bacterium]